jgi:hypothetical protein
MTDSGSFSINSFVNHAKYEKFEQELEALFEELITQQQQKVLQTARIRLSHLTADDILNPHDFPDLMRDPIFNYEEGLAAGLMTAQMAIRARLLQLLKRS